MIRCIISLFFSFLDHSALTTVDRERDLAQETLDEKTERLVECETQLEALKTTLKIKEEEVREDESFLNHSVCV